MEMSRTKYFQCQDNIMNEEHNEITPGNWKISVFDSQRAEAHGRWQSSPLLVPQISGTNLLSFDCPL